mmetsp:Transcript_26573/g.57962  ORF Transcript_26573/g.57962 Transcript_26573/m.57962 type:complete len:230 (+) Transcript_26573:684-1373(+)
MLSCTTTCLPPCPPPSHKPACLQAPCPPLPPTACSAVSAVQAPGRRGTPQLRPAAGVPQRACLPCAALVAQPARTWTVCLAGYMACGLSRHPLDLLIFPAIKPFLPAGMLLQPQQAPRTPPASYPPAPSTILHLPAAACRSGSSQPLPQAVARTRHRQAHPGATLPHRVQLWRRMAYAAYRSLTSSRLVHYELRSHMRMNARLLLQRVLMPCADSPLKWAEVQTRASSS